eukprot:766661-Hanusia_phi.AAC.4
MAGMICRPRSRSLLTPSAPLSSSLPNETTFIFHHLPPSAAPGPEPASPIVYDCWQHEFAEQSEMQTPSHQIHPSLLESCSSAAPCGPSSQGSLRSRGRRASIGTKAQEVLPAETSLPAPQVYKRESKKSKGKEIRQPSDARRLSNAMEGFERAVMMKKQSDAVGQLKRQSSPCVMIMKAFGASRVSLHMLLQRNLLKESNRDEIKRLLALSSGDDLSLPFRD